jgi:hypothetical protein
MILRRQKSLPASGVKHWLLCLEGSICIVLAMLGGGVVPPLCMHQAQKHAPTCPTWKRVHTVLGKVATITSEAVPACTDPRCREKVGTITSEAAAARTDAHMRVNRVHAVG